MQTTLPLEAHSPESLGLRTSLLNWVVFEDFQIFKQRTSRAFHKMGLFDFY